MNEFNWKDLTLIERSLSCMSGLLAAMNDGESFIQVQGLMLKVGSIKRATEWINEESSEH